MIQNAGGQFINFAKIDKNGELPINIEKLNVSAKLFGENFNVEDVKKYND